jgi:biopolymer transport protein ExbD
VPAAVRLKADGGVEAVRVVAIMELLRAAGIETLQLLTVPAPAGGG